MNKMNRIIGNGSDRGSEVCVCEAHLVLPLDDDDRHRGGRPAVFGRQGLVAVPQDDDLKGSGRDWITRTK